MARNLQACLHLAFFIGLIIENFQDFGALVTRRQLNNLVRTPFSWGAQSLSKRALRPSGPVALFGLNLKRLLATASSVTTVSDLAGRCLQISSQSSLSFAVSNLQKNHFNSSTKP